MRGRQGPAGGVFGVFFPPSEVLLKRLRVFGGDPLPRGRRRWAEGRAPRGPGPRGVSHGCESGRPSEREYLFFVCAVQKNPKPTKTPLRKRLKDGAKPEAKGSQRGSEAAGQGSGALVRCVGSSR